MNKNQFKQLLGDKRFDELLISEMGWSNPASRMEQPLTISDEITFILKPIAEKSGFKIFSCEVDKLPDHGICKKLDTKLKRRANFYIIIFVSANETCHHQWLAPIRSNERRDLVRIEYDNVEKTDFLFAKIPDLTLNDTTDIDITITDITSRIQKAFEVNSEKVTKEFFREFSTEHKEFKKQITGLADDIPLKDNKQKDWYASVMLNRLMFCYFIQKKGFLNGDFDYLPNKLREIRESKGENQFYGKFYKKFLRGLFQEGLNNPHHQVTFEKTFGRIPYLNGGMFDLHELEKEYQDIDIPDSAFVKLFEFFDKWNWHLDTRQTANGKDINPDVLGYIFEQYINDRASMGAYYTKEDITEYIGKNCILPFLMDKTAEKSTDAFKPKGYVWSTLKNSGDTYIYDAVKKGYSTDWQNRLPDYISKGIDTTTQNLLERRSRWNEKTFDEFALPTEIWRETIERLQRCESLICKIENGEITQINDFITYNLDIRKFVQDLIDNTDDHLFVLHFYEALQHVTILDPTCGSGAFLFAALNILEPLYEACIIRMQEWNKQNPNFFKHEMEEITDKYRSNIQYFIYKSIILRNLYGVDIMKEATEIAKLRLFLKMVAVVEVDKRADNMGLDPLPDIDFNIRCGNTLVGYANENEIERSFLNNADMFAKQEFEDKIHTELYIVAEAYNEFRKNQLSTCEDNITIKDIKKDLQQRLKTLNSLLNKHMYKGICSGNYEKWLRTHQPFHWIAEFYDTIVGKGGFDVIIGNPPYVEHSSDDVKYSLNHLRSADCGNLYGNCIERGLAIGSAKGKFSFIIPVAITCSKRMDTVISLLKKQSETLTFANFDDRPGKLFEMIEHLRATIFISSRGCTKDNPAIYSTKYNRWYSEHRRILFNNLCYVPVGEFVDSFIIPKFSNLIECSINRKLLNCSTCISSTYSTNSQNRVYYRAAGGGYFLLIKNQKSITYINGKLEDVKAEKYVAIGHGNSNTAIGALLSSSLFYWNYIGYTDCRNLTKSFIDCFKIVPGICNDRALVDSGNRLFENYERTRYKKDTTYRTTGKNVVYYEYYPKLSKLIIDNIDTILASHYGFSDEELDFIINYDIKYRMGDELEN